MTSTTTDLRDGVSTSVAIKAPVRSVCTSAITASGLSAISTIDGSLTPAAGDRFLLTAQSDSTANGIYVAASGTWERAKDFDTNRDVRKGTLIRTQNGIQYRVSASDPITIGTTALTFAADDNSNLATALASTAADQGADLVGINDANGRITAATVEDALQEITADGWVTSARIDSNAITPIKLGTSALPFSSLINGHLVASVAANALTVAIKTSSGGDPSATDPVYVTFRNATASSGVPSVLTLTAATSFTVSSGSTLGAASATAFRIWVVGFNDSGTFRLGVINCSSSTNTGESIIDLGRFPIASSTAEGGAGGADTALIFYTSSAVSSKAYVVLGYFTYESGLTTAGTWDAAPTRAELYHAGTPLPGATLQVRAGETGGVQTGTTTIPNDDTIPQSAEGDEYLAATITPSSAANILRIRARLNAAISAGSPMAAALFQDSAADALSATQTDASANVVTQMVIDHRMLAGTTSGTTFKLRAGPSTAGTMTVNGASGARLFGGVIFTTLECEEIMG